MFNDKYRLTEAVLDGKKTQTRRVEGPESKGTRYQIGEIVAVAQSSKTISDNSQSDPKCAEKKAEIWKVINKFIPENIWWNKMFTKPELMPYQIEITGIRREKLHDISNEDCLAEGIFERDGKYFVPELCERKKSTFQLFDTPQGAYAALIDKIGHNGDWNMNPEVVVYEFKLL